ncbi:unnamed protein product [Rotaria socialis]|uniref:Fibronectin type III-like domain-containing protein n=1 Tax=Rotaria socialis TaxID=392032 RepID=A0A817WBP5_9BILA|nr:unnamed protein product [Rotaria socialis]
MVSSYSIQSLLKHNHKLERTVISLIRVNITNTGNMAGDDIVLAYITLPNTIDRQIVPFKQLFGFEPVLTIPQNSTKWPHPGFYCITIARQLMLSIEFKGRSDRWA